jgi:hypothetical protein
MQRASKTWLGLVYVHGVNEPFRLIPEPDAAQVVPSPGALSRLQHTVALLSTHLDTTRPPQTTQVHQGVEQRMDPGEQGNRDEAGKADVKLGNQAQPHESGCVPLASPLNPDIFADPLERQALGFPGSGLELAVGGVGGLLSQGDDGETARREGPVCDVEEGRDVKQGGKGVGATLLQGKETKGCAEVVYGQACYMPLVIRTPLADPTHPRPARRSYRNYPNCDRSKIPGPQSP